MLFKEHVNVMTADDRKIGRLNKVVVDPETDEVTHLVIRKGVLLTRDKVISIDQVKTTSEDMVLLKRDVIDPDELPDFEETHYIPVGGVEDFSRRRSEEAKRIIWYHSQLNIPFWRSNPSLNRLKPLFIKKTRRNIPEGTIPVEEGAKVIDAEGESVGELEQVFAEPVENRVTHVLISRGLFTRDKKLIPVNWIKDIHENAIRLFVTDKVLQNLPSADID